MAPHSSTLAWKIPWMEEPGRLQSMGSLGVGHDWATSLSLFHFHVLEKEMATHSSVLAWRIPRMGSLVGCHLWGYTESDTTEVNHQQQQQHTLTKMFKIAESLFINSFSPSFQSPTGLRFKTVISVSLPFWMFKKCFCKLQMRFRRGHMGWLGCIYDIIPSKFVNHLSLAKVFMQASWSKYYP